MSLRWCAFLCGFGSDVLFKIDHLRSISFFCQNAHHDWLTKEYISNWFLVSATWFETHTPPVECYHKAYSPRPLSQFPGSLFPCWKNSMRSFARGSLYGTSSLAEVRFTTLYWQSSNMSWILKLVRYYVVIRSHMCQHCEISKKLIL